VVGFGLREAGAGLRAGWSVWVMKGGNDRSTWKKTQRQQRMAEASQGVLRGRAGVISCLARSQPHLCQHVGTVWGSATQGAAGVVVHIFIRSVKQNLRGLRSAIWGDHPDLAVAGGPLGLVDQCQIWVLGVKGVWMDVWVDVGMRCVVVGSSNGLPACDGLLRSPPGCKADTKVSPPPTTPIWHARTSHPPHHSPPSHHATPPQRVSVPASLEGAPPAAAALAVCV